MPPKRSGASARSPATASRAACSRMSSLRPKASCRTTTPGHGPSPTGGWRRAREIAGQVGVRHGFDRGPSACRARRAARARRACARAGTCRSRAAPSRTRPLAISSIASGQEPTEPSTPIRSTSRTTRPSKSNGIVGAPESPSATTVPPGRTARTPRRSRRDRRRTGSRRRSGRARGRRSRVTPAAKPSVRGERRAESVARGRRSRRRRGTLGARALGDEQADRSAPTTSTPLAGEPPRRTACSATEVGSTSAAERASSSTRCANAAGKTAARPSRRPCARSRSRCAARTDARGPARQRTQTPQPIATSPTTRSPGENPRTPRADVHDLARPLVPRHDRVLGEAHPEVGQRALEDLDVGAADADARTARSAARPLRRRIGPLDQFEPSPPWNSIARMASRIEQPSKERRTADDGDGTRQGIASPPR